MRDSGLYEQNKSVIYVRPLSSADENCTLTQSCRTFLPVFHGGRGVNGGTGTQTK